jgi:hypothetical protein
VLTFAAFSTVVCTLKVLFLDVEFQLLKWTKYLARLFKRTAFDAGAVLWGLQQASALGFASFPAAIDCVLTSCVSSAVAVSRRLTCSPCAPISNSWNRWVQVSDRCMRRSTGRLRYAIISPQPSCRSHRYRYEYHYL